jgi:hypothetical protein
VGEPVSATSPDRALVEKVRKLLALSESSNEHEAALAAEKAQELMLRYGIDMAQVAIAAGASTIGIDDARVETRLDPWRRQLADSIAKSMGGRVVFTRNYRTAHVMSFFGPAGTAQSIAALYHHLEAQLVTTSAIATANRAEKRVHGRTYRTSFLLGAVDRLDRRLARHRTDVQTDANSQALVIIGSALDRAIEERFGRLRIERDAHPTSLHWKAYTRGEKAAATVDLGSKRVGHRHTALPAGTGRAEDERDCA